MPEANYHIKEIMTRGVISAKPTDTVDKAIDIMTRRNISCIIVTSEENNKTPVGIITERDLVRKILAQGQDPKKIKLQTIMTEGVATISEHASLEEGMSLIEDMHIRRLPVVDEHENLVGLVTQTDIVHQTREINKHNQQLMFHQNLQSYIIIVLLAVFVLAFILKILILG